MNTPNHTAPLNLDAAILHSGYALTNRERDIAEWFWRAASQPGPVVTGEWLYRALRPHLLWKNAQRDYWECEASKLQRALLAERQSTDAAAARPRGESDGPGTPVTAMRPADGPSGGGDSPVPVRDERWEEIRREMEATAYGGGDWPSWDRCMNHAADRIRELELKLENVASPVASENSDS